MAETPEALSPQHEWQRPAMTREEFDQFVVTLLERRVRAPLNRQVANSSPQPDDVLVSDALAIVEARCTDLAERSYRRGRLRMPKHQLERKISGAVFGLWRAALAEVPRARAERVAEDKAAAQLAHAKRYAAEQAAERVAAEQAPERVVAKRGAAEQETATSERGRGRATSRVATPRTGRRLSEQAGRLVAELASDARIRPVAEKAVAQAGGRSDHVDEVVGVVQLRCVEFFAEQTGPSIATLQTDGELESVVTRRIRQVAKSAAQTLARTSDLPLDERVITEEARAYLAALPGALAPVLDRAVLQGVPNALTERQRGVLAARAAGHTGAEIAQVYGVTAGRVTQIAEQARQRALRALGVAEVKDLSLAYPLGADRRLLDHATPHHRFR